MRTLNTADLGPIRFPTPALQSRARDLLADAIAAQGAGYRNAADSVRAGGYANFWTVAALAAIETALRTGTEPE